MWQAVSLLVGAQAAVELCWLTCVSSALNGEELTRSGGIATLGRLLMRCVSVLPQVRQAGDCILNWRGCLPAWQQRCTSSRPSEALIMTVTTAQGLYLVCYF